VCLIVPLIVILGLQEDSQWRNHYTIVGALVGVAGIPASGGGGITTGGDKPK